MLPVVGLGSVGAGTQIEHVQVIYAGAFSTNDNWLRGWTEFDPQNANY